MSMIFPYRRPPPNNAIRKSPYSGGFMSDHPVIPIKSIFSLLGRSLRFVGQYACAVSRAFGSFLFKPVNAL